jgi:hypothetical protein
VPYTDPEKRREFMNEWRAANREKLRQASQKWRNANLEKARQRPAPTGKPIARKFARGSASMTPRSGRGPKNASGPTRRPEVHRRSDAAFAAGGNTFLGMGADDLLQRGNVLYRPV